MENWSEQIGKTVYDNGNSKQARLQEVPFSPSPSCVAQLFFTVHLKSLSTD